jgi:spermidine synthase
VDSITLVDIDPEMTRIARTFPPLVALNRGSLADPRVTVVNDDAMVWLGASRASFDVIVIDFPDPNNFALGKLYTTRFYALARARLAKGGAIVVQSTSPMFARESFWCVAETMEAAGFTVRAYHTAVPSFGEWGFALGKLEPFDAPTLAGLPGLRYLDDATLASMFVFGADMARVPVDVNRLNNQVLVQYYEREWKRWN